MKLIFFNLCKYYLSGVKLILTPFLTDLIQDAIETACEKCTDTQQEKTNVIFDHMAKNERGIWDELTAKYDPEGTWRKKYEKEAKERGIIIPQD